MTDTPTDDRLGTLRQTDDGWELRYVRRLGRAPATVWRAFVEPDLVAAWFPTSIRGELATGETLRFEMSDGAAEPFSGEVLEVDAPHLLAMAWGDDVLRFALVAVEGGTELTMTVLIAEHGKVARDAAGWHECLDNLVELWVDRDAHAMTVERFEPESWADVHPTYVERFGPAAATIGPPKGAGDARSD